MKFTEDAETLAQLCVKLTTSHSGQQKRRATLARRFASVAQRSVLRKKLGIGLDRNGARLGFRRFGQRQSQQTVMIIGLH